MRAGTWRSRTDRMIAVLGHELRNPLSAGMAGISAVAAMTDTSDPRHSFLERALHDLSRLSSLLDRYLEFGRSGSVLGNSICLRELVDRLAVRDSVRLVANVPGDAKIRGDSALLERALENLVDNAAKANASTVHLSARTVDGSVVIDVRDDGDGIPQDLVERIFEPFVSGGTSSGLGLALVAEVLESHGGSIDVVPAAAGARFRIALPAAEVASAAP